MINVIPSKDFFNHRHRHDGENIFFSERWINVLVETFGYRVLTAVETKSDKYICFAEINDFIGRRLVSLPVSDYIIPGMDNGQLIEVLRYLRHNYQDYTVRFRWAGINSEIAESAGLNIETAAVYHRVRVAKEEEMWRCTSRTFKRGVKKARQSSVEIRLCRDIDGLRRFYRLFALHRRSKFGILSPPFRFFEIIHKEFFADDQGFVLEALLDEDVIGTILVLKHKNILYYKYGASDLTKLLFRPNNLLFWELFNYASKIGCKEVDLGMCWLTDADQGLIRFKEGIGGVSRPISILSDITPGNNMVCEGEGRQVLRGVTKICVEHDVNENFIDRMGGLLFKYFT